VLFVVQNLLLFLELVKLQALHLLLLYQINSKKNKIKRLKKPRLTTWLSAQNKHIIIEGIYQNRFSLLKVFCTKHNMVHETNYYNYNRSLAGLSCCKNVTPNSRGGQFRDWRRTSQGRSWRNKVLRAWDNKCAITATFNNVAL
jgi:hypothetical protein